MLAYLIVGLAGAKVEKLRALHLSEPCKEAQSQSLSDFHKTQAFDHEHIDLPSLVVRIYLY